MTRSGERMGDLAMRVLVIDDSNLCLEMMRSVLTSSGHEVYTSSSAIGVSTIIYRQHIDVVVVDVELNSFRGERLVDLFRKQPRLDRLAVVLVSGQAQPAVEALAAASGADAAVSKRELELLPRVAAKAFAARRQRAAVSPAERGDVASLTGLTATPSSPP